MLTCRYWQSGTSANRVGMYKYISHRLAFIFKLKPLQSTSPVHCMAHWATSGKPPTPIRLTILLGSSTAHVQLLSGIVKTGVNDFGDWPGHTSRSRTNTDQHKILFDDLGQRLKTFRIEICHIVWLVAVMSTAPAQLLLHHIWECQMHCLCVLTLFWILFIKTNDKRKCYSRIIQ